MFTKKTIIKIVVVVVCAVVLFNVSFDKKATKEEKPASLCEVGEVKAGEPITFSSQKQQEEIIIVPTREGIRMFVECE